MNKSRHVTFRCTQEQYAKLSQFANEQEVSVSRLLQSLCDQSPFIIVSNTPLWTPEEIALLKDRDAPPLVINRIKDKP